MRQDRHKLTLPNSTDMFRDTLNEQEWTPWLHLLNPATF